MLTRRGWLLTLTSVLLVLVGRLLGVLELFVAGAAAGVLVIVTALTVHLTRLRLEVTRDVHPPRVHAGSPSRVDIVVRNLGRRRTPVLRLEDQVTGTRGAELLLSPLDPGATSRAAYRLPTAQRGLLEIGPLDVLLGDPFGLTEVRLRGAEITELTVLPHIDQVSPVPHTRADDPHAGADHPNALGRSGEDFYALRRYVVGDDLRRVHWRATARHDDLMVRQDELPWQGRATILVDVRRATTTPESLELTVSAAASIAHACWRRQDLVRLVSTDGADSGFAAGHAQVDAVMEHLATVEAAPEGAFRASVERLARSSVGGALVAVVSEIGTAELDALLGLGTRFGWLVIVRFEPSSWDPSATDDAARPVPRVARVTRDQSFPSIWEPVASRHRRAPQRVAG